MFEKQNGSDGKMRFVPLYLFILFFFAMRQIVRR